jgi:stringent starvation protein B
MAQTTSKRPYLIRAMHEWMTDNSLTPYVVIDASAYSSQVLEQYVSDEKIVLNVGYAATRNLVLGDDAMTFEARFEGVSRHIDVPTTAIVGIYAQETGQGMIFSEDDTKPPPDSDEPGEKTSGARPTLKVVK